MKRCTKCKEEKPRAEFNRDASKNDGLRVHCKPCHAASTRAYREANPEHMAEYRAANAERIAAQRAEHYAANRERESGRSRAWKAANRERVAEYGRAWREANSERYAAQRAEYYAANRERRNERRRAWYAANRERATEYARAWAAANPDKRSATQARRDASKLRRTPAWADQRQIEGFYTMAARVSTCLGIKHHVDHVLPLQGKLVSGLHVPSNLRVIPGVLNVKKGNRFVAFDRPPRPLRAVLRPRWITRAKRRASWSRL